LFKVHVVEDAQITADWALVDEADTFHLFVTRSANTAQTYAEVRQLMQTKRRGSPLLDRQQAPCLV